MQLQVFFWGELALHNRQIGTQLSVDLPGSLVDSPWDGRIPRWKLCFGILDRIKKRFALNALPASSAFWMKTVSVPMKKVYGKSILDRLSTWKAIQSNALGTALLLLQLSP